MRRRFFRSAGTTSQTPGRVGHFDDAWFRAAVGPGFQVGTKGLERARGNHTSYTRR